LCRSVLLIGDYLILIKHPVISRVSNIILALLSFIIIFFALDHHSIYIWDEAIYANNALEMSIDNDPFILKVNGEKTLYNTKPPLVIWMQASLIKLLGPTIWAIRLPSALAALMTCIIIYSFISFTYKKIWTSWLAVFILITSTGYMKTHVVRSGDLDSTLVLISTMGTLLVVIFSIYKKWNSISIYSIYILLLIGYFTKSTAILLFLPGWITCTLIYSYKQFVILWKPIILGGVTLILVILSYYNYVDHFNEGYIAKVFFSEYQRIYMNIMTWHNHPFYYYILNQTKNGYFMPYFSILIWIPGMLLYMSKTPIRKILMSLMIISVMYMCIISIPSVKLEWYDAPLYPLYAVICAIVISQFYDFISRSVCAVRFHLNWLFLAIVMIMIGYNYYQIIRNYLHPQYMDLEHEGRAISELYYRGKLPHDLQVIMGVKHKEHIDATNFYIRGYNHYHKYDLSLITDMDMIKEDKPFMICNSSRTHEWAEEIHYKSTACLPVDTLYGCYIYSGE